MMRYIFLLRFFLFFLLVHPSSSSPRSGLRDALLVYDAVLSYAIQPRGVQGSRPEIVEIDVLIYLLLLVDAELAGAHVDQ